MHSVGQVGCEHMLDAVFIELMDGAASIKREPSDNAYFQNLCSKLGLANISYLGVNLPVKNSKDYFAHNTYSGEWARRYETENYVRIDPIVRRGLNSLLPIDWSDFGQLTHEQQKFFGEAREFKVGQRGLTFPLHGLHGETAVFSVTANFSEREWRKFVARHLRDLRIVGDLFHQRVIEDELKDEGVPKVPLTRRELECLKWSAEGKSQSETAGILGLSERTVRFFLEGARHKLGCYNTTHAVAAAMLRGIL